ncbi:MAG: hypothetical protein KGD59_02375 [Candidatus Heimdallarchaeota archaeon]|nr:hypothetical protein [Candidatus Heimdallarchaeota archaeon]MBY8993367.1 hypothetical protein [Candidatus Heimdallarchaeota archaeon]
MTEEIQRQLPKRPFIRGKLNPRKQWVPIWVCLLLTILIATPMSLILALIFTGTTELALNFGWNLAVSAPIAFVSAYVFYTYMIGPLAERVVKYDFQHEMRTKTLGQMLKDGKFWLYGLFVDFLICIFIALPVAFVKVAWIGMNFQGPWGIEWMKAFGLAYALAVGLALIGIIITIQILKWWLWKPPIPDATAAK